MKALILNSGIGSRMGNSDALTFIEAKSIIGSRQDLGRPTTSAIENKKAFMNFLK